MKQPNFSTMNWTDATECVSALNAAKKETLAVVLLISHGPIDKCKMTDCVVCAVIECPHNEPFHFHHDGCPTCDS